MKNLIIASAIALTSILSVAGPSQAASVVVTTTERSAPRHDMRDMRRDDHRDDRRADRRHGPSKDCFTKKERIRDHGRMVTKTTRVCR